jgi:hypothetical protein
MSEKKRLRRRRAITSGVIGAGVIALVIAVILVRPGSKQTLSGSVTVRDSDERNPSVLVLDTWCGTRGGYADISSGADVIVKDGEGVVIALSELSRGTAVSATSCRFDFIVELPSSDFYSFNIGNRNEVTYSKADLMEQDWRLDLSLGN